VPRALAQYVGRALSCFHQAVFALRWFRDNRDVTALARDHDISRATGYRYLDEVIAVLAAQAPDLHEALEQAHNGSPSARPIGELAQAALVLTRIENVQLRTSARRGRRG
jgi:hypothetical protein